MRKIDLAYIAGIVDGEGYIGIKSRAGDGRSKGGYQIRFGVANTNLWLCEWLKFLFGGHISRRIPKRIEHKESYYWSLDAAQARPVLELLLPYLRLKRPQAEIAIQLQKNMTRRRLERFGRARTKTTEENLIDDDLYAKLRTLTKRGPGA